MKLVSVLIPAHNEEKSIGEAIKLLRAQNYKDVEIIVIDNASVDKTAEIARSLGATVLYEKQKGTNFALECGRLNAKGEILARLDADCLPDDNWVERGARHFENPKVMAVTGPYDYYDGGGSFRYISLFIQKTIYPLTNSLFQLLHVGAILTGGNSMMRAENMAKIGGFDTSITFYGDDTNTAKRLSKVGHVIFDTKFIVKTSARRFKAEGTLKIFWLYLLFFIKTTFGSMNKTK